MKNTIIFILISLIAIFASCNKSVVNNSIKKDAATAKIKVGVFNGNGASPICVIETIEALRIDRGIEPKEISASDIMRGELNNLDVLVFPGGSGSKEYNNLGQKAAKLVKDFSFKDGKGLVGICAGGYLFANTPGYSNLKILDSPHIRDYYDRGRGLIAFNLNKKGKEIFYELKKNDSLYVQYYDGPIYDIKNDSKIEVVGEIYSDIATHKGYPHDVTQGKPSFLTMDYGKGKVFVSVGHPEATAGMRWMVPRMARWVAGKPLVTYSPDLIKPEINNREILFYKDTKKYEKENWWKLFDEDDTVIMQSINNLYGLRSRPSIRWSIGLLRHESFPVRLAAAEYLLRTEYTYALPDIKAAFDAEKNTSQKEKLYEIYKKLKSYVE